jgi:hypothetical protein
MTTATPAADFLFALTHLLGQTEKRFAYLEEKLKLQTQMVTNVLERLERLEGGSDSDSRVMTDGEIRHLIATAVDTHLQDHKHHTTYDVESIADAAVDTHCSDHDHDMLERNLDDFVTEENVNDLISTAFDEATLTIKR